MLNKSFLERLPTIMEEKFRVGLNILSSDNTRNETMSGMLKEPLRTVVVKTVVNFVPQGCTIVLQFNKLSYSKDFIKGKFVN